MTEFRRRCCILVYAGLVPILVLGGALLSDTARAQPPPTALPSAPWESLTGPELWTPAETAADEAQGSSLALAADRGSVKWDGSVLAQARAQQSGWGASNPADVSATFQVDSAAPSRQWVPNPPVAEANWNNDNWVSAGNFSWHTATSGGNLVRGQGKAKAGMNADGSIVVDARARVRNCAAGDTARGYGKATMNLPLVLVLGPGTSVDATLNTAVYVAAPGTSPSNAQRGTAVGLATCPVGAPFKLSCIDEAEAIYPQILGPIFYPFPGSQVTVNTTVDDQPVYSGSVVCYQPTPEAPPVIEKTGALAVMTMIPWSGAGSQGQQRLTETGDYSFYGAVYQRMTLPTGYTFVEAPGCPEGSTVAQLPHGPGEAWNAYASEEAADSAAYESFSGLTRPIISIRFWGLNHDSGGAACSEDPMSFEIKVYEDSGGTPGAEICSSSVSLAPTDTGVTYNGFPLYQYDADIDPECSATNGWISIVGSGDTNCWFQWMSARTGDGSSVQYQAGTWTTNLNDLSICIKEHEQPFPEFTVASTATEWGDRLTAAMAGGITPVETLDSAALEELAELGMSESQFRPARLYPVEDLDGHGRDGLVMAFGDDPVTTPEEFVTGFDYHIGFDYPEGYGFWSGHDKDLRWCYRRVQFWNYWYWPPYYYPYYYWPWYSKKLIVFYDSSGNRLMLDYAKWWRWWPWPYNYWWKYRIYPYYPWPWSWWRPYNSYQVVGPFNPWRVVRIRYWETAWWYPVRPYPPIPWGGVGGPWWPPGWPWPKDGERTDPPAVPWNAWGDMMIEGPEGSLPPCGSLPGDVNGDGTVNIGDYDTFNTCLDYPNSESSERCTCVDFDGDYEITLQDFAAFQRAVSD